jgi:hypothetical protein
VGIGNGGLIARVQHGWKPERLWDAKHRYVAFVDPSGGSSDSMTPAIGHRGKRGGGVGALNDLTNVAH